MEKPRINVCMLLVSLIVPFLTHSVAAKDGLQLHQIAAQDKDAVPYTNEPKADEQGQTADALGIGGLAAHWTLDEADYDGNYLDTIAGYTAEPAGEPNFVDGVRNEPNGAIMIALPTGWGLSESFEADLVDGFTICLWVNWNGDWQEPVGASDLALESGGSEYVVSNSIKADQRWQHVCITYESGIARFYVNGGLRLSQTCELPTGSEVAVEIGNTQGLQIFNGAIDDIRLYNRALTQTQITQLVTGRGDCILQYSMKYDLSGPYDLPDCSVDLYDMAGLSRQWLENCLPEDGPEYDFSGPQGLPDCTVNLYDLAEFCNNWLSSGW